MHGTNATRVARLVADLVIRPQNIQRYLAQNVLRRTTPLDLEVPWFSYGAIDFLKTYVRPDMTVCEYGSGGSTLFFAQRAKSVLSIEDHAQWRELVLKRLNEKGIRNATVLLHPFNFHKPDGFEQSAYLNAIPDEKFDIVVVDGTEEDIQVRPACFYKAEDHVKPDGIIIVDDSWRYLPLREKNRAKSFRIFRSTGPCRPGVTSTDIFFY